MASNIDSLSHSLADFSVALYKKASESVSSQDNVFLSPFSVAYALAMCYAGSNTTTKDEMKHLLFGSKSNLSDQAIHDSFAEVMQTLNSPKAAYKLHIANRLYASDAYAQNLLESFVQLLLKKYASDLHLTNFKEAGGENARKLINDWVSGKTNEKIQNLIAPGVLNDDTRLVLVNAIYFKGDWLSKFEKEQTEQKPFYAAPNKELKLDTMHKRGKKFPYGETEEFQVLGIPYQGEELAMFIFLPHERYGLEKVEKGLTGEKVLNAILNTRDQELEVIAIPKFKLEQSFGLSDALKQLGATEMFSDKADFSNISGKKDLKVSEVIHKAFVEVNEEGTQAAASTAIEISTRSLKPSVMVNHPFLFTIFDKKNKNVLFLGRFVGLGMLACEYMA